METQTYEDEINLRELIEILLKGWKPLIIIPLVTALFIFSFSKYIVEPTYESQSIIQVHVSEGNTTPINTTSIDDILSSRSLTPGYSIESYIQQIISPEVLLATIKTLNFEKSLTFEQLKSKITITPIQGSSLITLSVKDSDPKRAATIVNTVSETFINYIAAKQVEQLDNSTELLENQLSIEKEKLDQALQATKTFNSMKRNLINVTQELKLSEEQFNSTESELIILKDSYDKNKFSLSQDILLSKEKIDAYNILLNETHQNYTLNTHIFDSGLSSAVVSSSDLSLEDQTNLSVATDELNPVYISTSEILAKEQIHLIELEKSLEKASNMYKYNLKTLNEQSENLQILINTLRNEFAELTYQESLLNEELTIAKNTYNAFNKKLESARVAKAAKISDTSVLLMSKGYITTEPIGPKILTNTIIGAILSCMCVTFAIYFNHYWHNSKIKK